MKTQIDETNNWFKAQDELHHGIDPTEFYIGCANMPDRRALMLMIEAARHLCGMDKRRALSLLDAAKREIFRNATT